MPRAALIATVVLATASTAAAGDGRARKPGRPKAPDVAAALATRDPARICQVAIDLVAAGDPARGGLLLPRCAEVPAEQTALADAARKARIAVRKVADAQGWSPVEIVVRTTGATITIEPYVGIAIEPGAVNLPPGTYRVVARTSAGVSDHELTVTGGKRALVMLTPPSPPPPPRAKVVDFGDDQPAIPVVGAPPRVKHDSLIPERYRKGLCAGNKCPR